MTTIVQPIMMNGTGGSRFKKQLQHQQQVCGGGAAAGHRSTRNRVPWTLWIVMAMVLGLVLTNTVTMRQNPPAFSAWFQQFAGVGRAMTTATSAATTTTTTGSTSTSTTTTTSRAASTGGGLSPDEKLAAMENIATLLGCDPSNDGSINGSSSATIGVIIGNDTSSSSSSSSDSWIKCQERARVVHQKHIAGLKSRQRLLDQAQRQMMKELTGSSRATNTNQTANRKRQQEAQEQLEAIYPLLLQMPEKFRPDPVWSNVTFPDLIIAGMPKAGTSQLYYILQSHPDVAKFAHSKEFCMIQLRLTLNTASSYSSSSTDDDRSLVGERELSQNKDLPQRLHRWHRDLYANKTRAAAAAAARRSKSARSTRLPGASRSGGGIGGAMKQKRTVNGCVSFVDTLLHVQYLNKPSNRKYFILFRDPADWIWAAWNYWTDIDLDATINKKQQQSGGWTKPDQNYRSPELFHELVASGGLAKGLSKLEGMKFLSVHYPRRLIALVGRENVLTLRNEDMMPQALGKPGGLLDRVSEFAKLYRPGFNKDRAGVFTIRNCNDAKGSAKPCPQNNKTSAYAIAGNREMLPETRELIYIRFARECRIWANEFDVHYPRCLEAMTTREQQQQQQRQ